MKRNIKSWCKKFGQDYITTAQVRWEIGKKGSGLWLEVPPGFLFDVSIPKPLQWWLDPHDERYLKAACLHDYALLELGWDRVSSAAPFSEALKGKGVPTWERLLMVLAVIAWRYK